MDRDGGWQVTSRWLLVPEIDTKEHMKSLTSNFPLCVLPLSLLVFPFSGPACELWQHT
jgi:hypothetical protein